MRQPLVICIDFKSKHSDPDYIVYVFNCGFERIDLAFIGFRNVDECASEIAL